MCGRFTLSHSREELAEHFDVELDSLFAPRHNIAPTQPVMVVRENPHLLRRELAHVVWALIPPWAEDIKIGSRMINARAETVAIKPAYRLPFRRRRCLVPASGFYEWCVTALGAASPSIQPAAPDDLFAAPAPAPMPPRPGRKQPFFIQMKSGEPMGLAGLWETWCGPNGEVIDSCTVITTSANELIAEIHERMPVIVNPSRYAEWLNLENEDVDQLQKFLQPYPAAELEKYPVAPPRDELKPARLV